jgi:hypothetical protein
MNTATVPPSHVLELIQLLGEPVLLLAWPLGSKGDKIPWKHLDNKTTMSDTRYLYKLGGGNIGVALGDKSGGLISIDFDDDDALRAFLSCNTAIRDTLISRGKRGGNVWYRMEGLYPDRVQHIKKGRTSVGEWRTTGGQTIIYGQHPDGGRYELVNNKPPMRVRFDQIVWPQGLTGPALLTEQLPQISGADFQQAARNTTALSSLQLSSVLLSAPLSSSVNCVDDCVLLAMPDGPGANHSALFRLARGLLTLAVRSRKPLTLDEKVAAFDQWHSLANERGVLKVGQTRDQYLGELLDACENAKHPIQESSMLMEALNTAKAQDTESPPESQYFTSESYKLLVKWCFYIQKGADLLGKPWFLPCRYAGKHLGVSHTEASKMLKTLVRFSVLDVTEISTTTNANRYRYKSKNRPEAVEF